MARKGNEYDYLSKQGTALVGRKINAYPATIPDALGYTMPGHDGEADIFVAQEHELFAGLNQKEKRQIRIGVGMHEILHQLYTDFEAEDRYIARIPGVKKYMSEGSPRFRYQILHEFSNMLEDTYIEMRGIEEIGGNLIKCLKYAIVTIFDKTDPIDEASDAFTQYMGGLINLGDLGCVKGTWTYPEAYEYFRKSIPLYIEGMKASSPIKRVHYSFLMMQLSEPLWKEEEEEAMKSEEAFKKMMEALKKELKKRMSGSESDGEDESGEDSPSGSSSSGSASKSSKSGKSGKCKGKMSLGGGKYNPDSELSDLLDEITKCEGGSDSDESKDSSKSEDGDDKDSESNEKGPSAEELEKQMEEILKEKGDIRKDSKLSKEERENLEESVERAGEEPPKKNEIGDLTDTPKQYTKSYKLGNEKISAEDHAEQYAALRRPIAGQIAYLSKRLTTIFEAKSEDEWAQKGKFNVKRYATHETSTRWFQKTTESKGDVAVEVLIDESGSMRCSNKYAKARMAVIMFAEACRANKIPCYVMGFSADEHGCDVYHRHYVGWSLNSPLESLAMINAYCNNFDGYSIRAAGEIIKKRQESTKLLIVISDGEPAANAYCSRDLKGNADTKNAIDSVRKNGIEVFGVGIEGCGPEMLQQFYGPSDCLFLDDPNQLGTTMFKKLKDCIEKKK